MQDLALILLVNGKEDFTKRWLKYMSKIEFKHKIVIGNGNKKSNLLIKELIKKKFILILILNIIHIIIRTIKIIIL